MAKTRQPSFWEEPVLELTGDDLVAVCFGAGVNSVAALCGLYERGIVPHWILFSDTGGEWPATYDTIGRMNEWLDRRGWPLVQTLSYATNSKYDSLEDEMLRKSVLPGLAFGMATCSIKWKQGPFDKYFNRNELARWQWEEGRPITRVIGFQADEGYRCKRASTYMVGLTGKKYRNWFPLRDWHWDRGDCIEAILRHGLPVPRKSACWFCPASKPDEIRQLHREHPELYARAIEMERRALPKLKSTKGLSRHFAWRDVPLTV